LAAERSDTSESGRVGPSKRWFAYFKQSNIGTIKLNHLSSVLAVRTNF